VSFEARFGDRAVRVGVGHFPGSLSPIRLKSSFSRVSSPRKLQFDDGLPAPKIRRLADISEEPERFCKFSLLLLRIKLFF